MNIDIIAVGKIKENFLTKGIKEYQKRLSAYCNLRIIEVAEEKAPESLSDREKEQVLEREGNNILRKINPTFLCHSTVYRRPLPFLRRNCKKVERPDAKWQISYYLYHRRIPWPFRCS